MSNGNIGKIDDQFVNEFSFWDVSNTDKDLGQTFANIEMVATAVLVGSAVITALISLRCFFGGILSIVFGGPFAIAGFSVVYLAYNIAKLSKNMKDASMKPDFRQQLLKTCKTEEQAKKAIKQELLKGTIGFKWGADWLLKKLIENS